MSWTVCLLVLNTIIFQNRWQFVPSIHNNFLYSTKISIDPQLFPSIHNNFLYSTKVSIVPQLFSFSTILSFIPHDCLYNSPVYTPHWLKYCSLSTILCSFLHAPTVYYSRESCLVFQSAEHFSTRDFQKTKTLFSKLLNLPFSLKKIICN